MKYLKPFNEEVWFIDKINKYKIDKICKKYGIKDYTINSDESIDAKAVYLSDKGLTKLPLKFNKVNGYFYCNRNKLTSLEGSPKEVNGNFDCTNNQLTSLEGCPKEVNGYFSCSYNKLTSFEYFPSFVKYNFYCGYNPIFEVWKLFKNKDKIELLNDFDIFRDEDTDTPSILMNRLNDFLLTIGKDPVKKVDIYKNI